MAHVNSSKLTDSHQNLFLFQQKAPPPQDHSPLEEVFPDDGDLLMKYQEVERTASTLKNSLLSYPTNKIHRYIPFNKRYNVKQEICKRLILVEDGLTLVKDINLALILGENLTDIFHLIHPPFDPLKTIGKYMYS